MQDPTTRDLTTTEAHSEDHHLETTEDLLLILTREENLSPETQETSLQQGQKMMGLFQGTDLDSTDHSTMKGGKEAEALGHAMKETSLGFYSKEEALSRALSLTTGDHLKAEMWNSEMTDLTGQDSTMLRTPMETLTETRDLSTVEESLEEVEELA